MAIFFGCSPAKAKQAFNQMAIRAAAKSTFFISHLLGFEIVIGFAKQYIQPPNYFAVNS